MPKPSRPSKSTAEGMSWSVGAGTNLLSGFTAKLFSESKQTLNEFAKELRAFSSVDMSGILYPMVIFWRLYYVFS